MKDEDYNITEEQDQLGIASFTDCTGLIPSGTVDEKELAIYRDLYPFGQPNAERGPKRDSAK
ncbi:MAG: hypothetical protein DBX58_01870 [Clostridiales bacterium]|nr:MAG: hypothetical protein DBX58_01870 [Clostridiales bacterium]HJA32105.1 hypothetical protein [Candidatus Eisenbergiella pullicola]